MEMPNFSLYAQFLHEGALRSTDLISSLAGEPFTPDHFVNAADPTQAGTYSVWQIEL
jgi:hypothetical protein